MLGALFSGLLLVLQHANAQSYSDALSKSTLLYEANRSGWLPDNNRIYWRGDSTTTDGSEVGLDLTGGWFDAGDHPKFGFPHAWSATTVAWGLVDFRDGYSSAGQLDIGLDSLKWALDYFVRCHPEDNVLYGQVGDGHHDHAMWTRPENPEVSAWRPCWAVTTDAPGSDLAGETAASLAAGSMAFRDTDSGYADTLLDHAKRLFTFATTYQGFYTDTIPATDFYGSTAIEDELCIAAAWLYRATGEQTYLDSAISYYSSGVPWAFSWDDKNAECQLLMYITTGDAQYSGHVQAFLDSWRPGGGITYTPWGLAHRDQWGPLRYAANTAAISVIAALHGIDTQASIDWAKTQIDYMIDPSKNPMGISYQIKEGSLGWSPRKPHHRGASCNPDHSVECDWDDYNSPNDNPSELIGALVGGPDVNDWYSDDRSNYITNEVATDYNAGFQTALAGLVQLG